jgi:AraC family transcriptional regulator
MQPTTQGPGEPVGPEARLEFASLQAAAETSDVLGWSGVRAEHLSDPPDREIEIPPVTDHWLVLNHRVSPVFSLRLEGQARDAPPPPGLITIIPAGSTSHWRWSGPSDSTHVLLKPQLLSRVAVEAFDLDPDRVTLPPVYELSHPQIRSAMLALDEELRTGGAGGRLLAESLANGLAVHLLRRFTTPGRDEAGPRDVLPARKRKAVMEYIEEHLDAELALDHLAALAHLSPYHFARLFKNSTGLPPHQYVIARRVERAKGLLRNRDRFALADIALEVGFSSQSHFTRHFKRLVGVTPRRFR